MYIEVIKLVYAKWLLDHSRDLKNPDNTAFQSLAAKLTLLFSSRLMIMEHIFKACQFALLFFCRGHNLRIGSLNSLPQRVGCRKSIVYTA
jgi:hypothetical protein